MGKTLIRVSCIDQRLVVVSPPVIASGGRNEDMVEFEFCPLWAGFSKTAVFYRDAADPYHAVVTDDKCIIPWEVLQTDGFVYFGVFGVKNDITRTSEVIRYRVTAGAITEGTKPSDPTPDIYEQLLGKMSNVESLIASSDPYSLTGKLVQLDNFEGMPMNAVTRIEPVQAGSGDPSPSNIRPISGHTGAKLVRCGKNLLPLEFNVGTSSGVAVAKSDGVLALSGTASSTAVQSKSFPTPLPPGQYAFSLRNTVGSATVRINLSYADGTDIASLNCGAANAVKVFTATKPITTYKLVIMSGSVADCTMMPQLEFASSVTEHEPYRCDAFSASFGQTVYGGALDWKNGVLTVTHAYKKIDTIPDSSDIAVRTNSVRFYVSGYGDYATGDTSRLASKCNQLVYKNVYSEDAVGFQISEKSGGNIIVALPISVGTTASAVRAWLANNPLEFAIVLPNPTTIQLTPAQLTALQGMNNIFCDAGETTVSGRKDILWLTSGLLQRIQTLESTIATLEAAALSE